MRCITMFNVIFAKYNFFLFFSLLLFLEWNVTNCNCEIHLHTAYTPPPPPPSPSPSPITPKHPAVSLLIRLKVSIKRRGTHWLGVPGGERVGRLWVSSLSSDSEFLLTASQSVTPINFLSRGLLGDLRDEMQSVNLCHTPVEPKAKVNYKLVLTVWGNCLS